MFVSETRRGIVADDWLRGPPDLVVEILSPSKARRERGIKLQLYERQGILEYWIVDPDSEAVEVWQFGEGRSCHRFSDRLPVTLACETLGHVELAEVFQRD